MKIEKRLHNVSDFNDKEICRFRLSGLKKYVANLKRYLDDEREKIALPKCMAIESEIEAWTGFFKMSEKLNMKSGNPTRVKSN